MRDVTGPREAIYYWSGQLLLQVGSYRHPFSLFIK